MGIAEIFYSLKDYTIKKIRSVDCVDLVFNFFMTISFTGNHCLFEFSDFKCIRIKWLRIFIFNTACFNNIVSFTSSPV